jgi:hypothetical protein
MAAAKSEKRVVAGPCNIDGGVARLLELPDGSGRVESWKVGVGWVEGGASPDEFIFARPVSPLLAAQLGIPQSELTRARPYVDYDPDDRDTQKMIHTLRKMGEKREKS